MTKATLSKKSYIDCLICGKKAKLFIRRGKKFFKCGRKKMHFARGSIHPTFIRSVKNCKKIHEWKWVPSDMMSGVDIEQTEEIKKTHKPPPPKQKIKASVESKQASKKLKTKAPPVEQIREETKSTSPEPEIEHHGLPDIVESDFFASDSEDS